MACDLGQPCCIFEGKSNVSLLPYCCEQEAESAVGIYNRQHTLSDVCLVPLCHTTDLLAAVFVAVVLKLPQQLPIEARVLLAQPQRLLPQHFVVGTPVAQALSCFGCQSQRSPSLQLISISAEHSYPPWRHRLHFCFLAQPELTF